MDDKLDELKKKMYSAEGPKERKQKDFYEAVKKGADKANVYWEEEAGRGKLGGFSTETSLPITPPEKKEAAKGEEVSLPKKRPLRKKILLAFIAFSAVSLVAVAGFIYTRVAPQTDAIVFEISGDESTDAGELKVWKILFRNGGDVAVKNAEFTFNYPLGTVPEEDEAAKTLRKRIVVDEIRPGEERTFDFSGRIFGSVEEEKTAEAVVVYQLENVSSRLVKKVTLKTVIALVPLAVSYDLPVKVVSGQDMKIVIDVTSSSHTGFKDLFMRIDYPSGFKLTTSDIKPDFENNIWRLGDIGEGENRRITIEGVITGFPEELKPFVAHLGEYSPDTRQWKVFFEKSGDTQMASPLLFVRQEVNRKQDYVARFGEFLNFTVYYKNSMPTAVRDVFIRVKPDAQLLDIRSLKADKGFFDGASGEIVWNAATDPNLKELDAGKEGSVIFSVPVKKQPVITGFSDKDFVITSVARINTQTIPRGFEGVLLEYQDTTEVKLETQLSLVAKAIFYNSPLGQNIGSLPPRVNKETGYTIIFQLSNLSNDIRDARLYAALPGNVRWLNQVTGDRTEKLSFNPSSGELIWDVGDIPAGTGFVRSRLFLAFNVSVTPGQDAISRGALLAKGIRVTGIDVFTKSSLQTLAPDVTTELKGDPLTNQLQWIVAP